VTHYIDTSAFVKLFMAERESEALRRWWVDHDDSVFSSDLLRTEVLRTSRRVSPIALSTARRFLDAIPLVSLDSASYDRAGLVDPPGLRSLDALHLTAATTIGEELTGIVTYDDRLAEAAARQGLVTIAPTDD